MVESYRTSVNAVGWTLAGIALVLVSSRLYTRSALVQKFGWDDAFMLIALALAIVTTSLVTLGTTYGFGLHVLDIKDSEDQANALKYTIIPPAICLMSTTFSKISVVLFLMRLLGMAAKLIHKIILYSATLLMVGGNILAIVVLLAYCTPREKAWKPLTPGTCMDPALLDIAGRTVTVYNAAMDMLYAGFAIALVWTLNMKTSTKWGLAVLMSGGVFGTAASIVKAVMMGNIRDTLDMTWAWAPIAIWYSAEMYVIIIAGSIPMLRPLWSFVRGKPYGSDRYTPGTGEAAAGPFSKQIDQKSTGNSKSAGGLTSGSQGAPGMFTIALRELGSDEEDESRSGAGSSRRGSNEDILPKDRDGAKNDKRESGRTSIKVQVRRDVDVEVGYVEEGREWNGDQGRFKGERNAFRRPGP